MPLATGTRLGPYELGVLIGAGGMGEVYRARDTRLDRTVAVKILLPNVAGHPQSRLRFEREARVVSRLNHPHICALYDVGHQDGREYLVMEYVDGDTLARRLDTGRLPFDQVLACAIDILEALDNAHSHGIVHRDLNPANVMLTRSGAKLLDFGLAKLRDPGSEATKLLDSGVGHMAERSAVAVPDASTRGQALTEARTILGTFQYMAPEQVEGKDADVRTDVFAFGAVLYELATGRKAFEASSQAGLIGAILLTDPPAMQKIDPAIPPALDRVVRRCLAKDPEERWQSSRDLLWHLTMIAQDAVSADSRRPRLALRAHAVWAAVTLVMATGIGLAVWNGIASSPRFARGPVRVHIDLPAGDRLAPGFYPSLALSPNGTLLVFRSEAQGTSQLFVRRLDSLDSFEAQPIPGTEGAHTPFFSPDGKWIGFLAKSKVMKVPIGGGLPQKICDAPSLSPGSPGAAWGLDDTIVFGAGREGLMRVDAKGGAPDRLTVPNVQLGELTHHGPQFLPGGKELLFTVRTVEGKSRVAVLSLASRRWDSLPIEEMVGSARYVGTGHLVYAQNSQTGRLFAVPFDLSQRKIKGIPLPQPAEVYTEAASDVMVAQFTVSDSGVLAYVTGHRPEFTLVKVTPDGVARSLTDDARTYRYPRVSPDGKQIAVSIAEDRSDIVVIDAERGTMRSITTVGSNTQPTWTPDGRRIVFASTRRGSNGYDIYSIPADEGADPEPLVVREGGQFPSSWSPTAPVLAFYELNNDTARDILVWKSEQRIVEKVLATRANERSATFSADGHWLAYVSDQLGRDEVYIQRYPGPGGRNRVSKDGGTEPVWSRVGHELFYRRGRQLLAVRMDTAEVLGESRVVSDEPYEQSAAEVGRPNYDVFPDGSFVMVRSEDKSAGRHVHVVLDWFEDLKAGFQGKR